MGALESYSGGPDMATGAAPMAKISFVDVGNGATAVTVPYPLEANYLPVSGVCLGTSWGAVDRASGVLSCVARYATELGVQSGLAASAVRAHVPAAQQLSLGSLHCCLLEHCPSSHGTRVRRCMPTPERKPRVTLGEGEALTASSRQVRQGAVTSLAAPHHRRRRGHAC